MSRSGSPPGPDLLARIGTRVLDLPPVRWLKPILQAYDAAGGGLLAAGLAFNSLFALVPAILLIVSLLGVFLNDPARLDALVGFLGTKFPPLREFLRQALAEFSGGAVSFSILGTVGLVWGSSRFYQSLDDAMARIFEGSPRRDPIQRGIRGVVSVGILVAAIIGAVYLVTLAQDLAGAMPGLLVALGFVTSTLGSGLGSILIFGLAIALIYRMVPTATPSWRAIRRPALFVGCALAAFTGIYALLGPRLVSLQVYGAFVAVFAAMVWLSFVAQAILIGAAWVHRRALAETRRRSD